MHEHVTHKNEEDVERVCFLGECVETHDEGPCSISHPLGRVGIANDGPGRGSARKDAEAVRGQQGQDGFTDGGREGEGLGYSGRRVGDMGEPRRQCEAGGDIGDEGVDRRSGVRERVRGRVQSEDELLDLEGYDVGVPVGPYVFTDWNPVAVAENSVGRAKRCECRRGKEGGVLYDIEDVEIGQCPNDGEKDNRLNGRIRRLDGERL